MKGSVRRERSFNTAESETLGMCGSSMRENREALQTPTLDSSAGRSKKAKSRNVDVHVCGESDGLVVPTKRANKTDAEEWAAESAEGRTATKGNAPQAHSCRTQSRGCESQGLWCVRQTARRDSIGIPTGGWPSDEPENLRGEELPNGQRELSVIGYFQTVPGVGDGPGSSAGASRKATTMSTSGFRRTISLVTASRALSMS